MSEVHVYIGTQTDDPQEGIYHVRLNTESGALTPVGATKHVPNPFFLIVNATGDRLYATNAVDEIDGQPEGAISAFAIEPESGQLSFLNRQPCRGKLPCYLSLNSSGKYLLTGNYNSGSVAVLPIAADGSLGPPVDSHQHAGSSVNAERQDGPHVHAIVLDPSEQWAYAPDLGIDKVMIYHFDAATGRLTPANPPFVRTAPGAGPRHLAFHPNGKNVYLLNELDGTFNVYDFAANSGALTELQSISTVPQEHDDYNYSADVQVLPSGDFLYGTNRGPDNIATFAIDPNSGRLTATGHADVQGQWPWNLAIDPTVQFLLTANRDSDNVVVLRIDRSTGQLTPTRCAVSVPKPVNVVIAPQVGA